MDYQELKKELKKAGFDFLRKKASGSSLYEQTMEDSIRFEVILHTGCSCFAVRMFDLKPGPQFVNGSPESVIDRLIRYDDWKEELNEINEFYKDLRKKGR